jgi:DNA-binding GntR family transcriptional regulator
MSLKSTDLISNIESVSKTKIRGVLALLKHGELLTTQGNQYATILLFCIHCGNYYYLFII